MHQARIELHLDLTPVAADDVDPADAGNRLEPGSDNLIGEVSDLAERPLAALQRDRHDRRVVRIEVLNDRVFDVRRQRPANARDLRLYVLLCDADIDPEVEGESNLRPTFIGARIDLLDSLYRVERLLERLRHLAHHDLGRRTGIARLDRDRGIGDVGVLVDGESPIAHDAEHHERHHHHGGEDGALDGDVGQEHEKARSSARAARRAGSAISCCCRAAAVGSDPVRPSRRAVVLRRG